MEKASIVHPMHPNAFDTALQNGRFYYPAWMHYGKPVNVLCDRCRASRLSVCIGFGSIDLCMICA